MSWLDDANQSARGRALAMGFGTVFQMMLATIDTADLDLIRRHDEQWSSVLPADDFGRIDDLSDLAVAYSSTLIGEIRDDGQDATPDVAHRVQDGLRLLRAVYRFGLLAWIFKVSQQDSGSQQTRQMAGFLAQHFTDRALLTFVAGRAIELSGDRRLAWWALMMQPREGDRVVVGSFVPALVATYLSRLMDLLPLEPSSVELDLPAEPWIERYEVELRDGVANAWPIESEPSFWAGERIERDEQIGPKRRRLAQAIDVILNDLRDARAARIRTGTIQPVYRELFIVSASHSWVAHRVLSRTLGALGAPHDDVTPTSVELLRSSVPKAGFVGESSNIHIESYGEWAGRLAAEAETAHILGLLNESQARPELRGQADQPLAERTIEAIRQLRDSGYEPSVVFVPLDPTIWSRLAADVTYRRDDQRQLQLKGVPAYLLRFVRARIAGVLVISLPALSAPHILIIDAQKALAGPEDFDPDGTDLQITFLERDPIETRAELLREEMLLDEQTLTERLNERLQQLVVLGSAELAYKVIDPAAIRIIG